MGRNVTTRTLSGGFRQVECFEEVHLLRCGFAYSVEAAASGICRVFLNAREDVEGDLGACGVPLGFQAHTHDPVQGEGQNESRSGHGRGCGLAACGELVRSRCRISTRESHPCWHFDAFRGRAATIPSWEARNPETSLRHHMLENG